VAGTDARALTLNGAALDTAALRQKEQRRRATTRAWRLLLPGHDRSRRTGRRRHRPL